jgi:hypothetical protein
MARRRRIWAAGIICPGKDRGMDATDHRTLRLAVDAAEPPTHGASERRAIGTWARANRGRVGTSVPIWAGGGMDG